MLTLWKHSRYRVYGNCAPVQVERTPIPPEDFDWLRDTITLLRNALADSVRLAMACNYPSRHFHRPSLALQNLRGSFEHGAGDHR